MALFRLVHFAAAKRTVARHLSKVPLRTGTGRLVNARIRGCVSWGGYWVWLPPAHYPGTLDRLGCCLTASASFGGESGADRWGSAGRTERAPYRPILGEGRGEGVSPAGLVAWAAQAV